MRSKAALFLVLFMISALLFGQRGPQTPPPTNLVAPNIPGVVAGGTPIQLVRSGFDRAEGPVAMSDGGILFTGRNSITRIDPAGNASTFVENSNGANGLGFDSKGRLISVQRGAGGLKVGVLYPPESRTVLVDSYEGKSFGQLNDIVVSTKGAAYFTDTSGDIKGIYYLPPGGKVMRVDSSISSPNGIQLSPDEKILYANDKDGEYLLAFDVRPDGTLANRRNFGKYQSVRIPDSRDRLLAEDNGADGLAVDSEGRVYAATNLGAEVFSPEGKHLGAIPIIWGGETFNLRKPANLAFSGPDKKTLYAVGAGTVFKVQMLAQGFKGRAK
ncbi:MAG TPA: SMP-30/gluconolactonase/LRE family protein [Terriglobia bacterium]|nr:SMP-30/gluconolactonase/LRE family protein [Terriglobia bacterium]